MASDDSGGPISDRRMGVAIARPSMSVPQTHLPANVIAVGRFGEGVSACLREQAARQTNPTYNQNRKAKERRHHAVALRKFK